MNAWLRRAGDSDIWWSFKSSTLTVVAAFATLFIILVALLAPVLAPHTPFDPATLSLSDGLKPPVLLSADGEWTFPLGTDDQVDHHEQEPDQHQIGGHHRDVGELHRLDEELADARPGEHRLGD